MMLPLPHRFYRRGHRVLQRKKVKRAEGEKVREYVVLLFCASALLSSRSSMLSAVRKIPSYNTTYVRYRSSLPYEHCRVKKIPNPR
jgi:protein tyrosine phosphatase